MPFRGLSEALTERSPLSRAPIQLDDEVGDLDHHQDHKDRGDDEGEVLEELVGRPLLRGGSQTIVIVHDGISPCVGSVYIIQHIIYICQDIRVNRKTLISKGYFY